MKKKKNLLLSLIILLIAFSVLVNLPEEIPVKFSFKKFNIDRKFFRPKLNLSLGGIKIKRDFEIKKGLDLAGGAHLVFRADMENISSEERGEALTAARNVIERRVNLFGLSEPNIRTSKRKDEYRVIVELAGIDNVEQAVDLIGQTAQLDFRLVNEATEAAQPYEKTGLTGKYLKKASPAFDPQSGEPVITLGFTSEGQGLFGEITENNVGRRLAIFLDEVILMAPLINEPIKDGDARISGSFTSSDVKRFSAQLNGGALPVPFELIEQRNIGPTLGEESIRRSTRAGMIGLLMVALFMVTYYGYLGFLADLGLIVYGLLTLALYRLIPVTMTLPGMAGFILSVGMAVDSNILIFERMKEEIRMGQSSRVAMELGFGRAWDSIRDANICTLIICFILFNPFDWSFLNTSGLIRGFAFTLGLGVILSLFTGIFITRTLLRTFFKKEI